MSARLVMTPVDRNRSRLLPWAGMAGMAGVDWHRLAWAGMGWHGLAWTGVVFVHHVCSARNKGRPRPAYHWGASWRLSRLCRLGRPIACGAALGRLQGERPRPCPVRCQARHCNREGPLTCCRRPGTRYQIKMQPCCRVIRSSAACVHQHHGARRMPATASSRAASASCPLPPRRPAAPRAASARRRGSARS